MDDKTTYVKNPKQSTKELLELIREFGSHKIQDQHPWIKCVLYILVIYNQKPKLKDEMGG